MGLLDVVRTPFGRLMACERSSNRSRDAALTRFEWKKWPPLPEEANQRDLDEMAPSVDS